MGLRLRALLGGEWSRRQKGSCDFWISDVMLYALHTESSCEQRVLVGFWCLHQLYMFSLTKARALKSLLGRRVLFERIMLVAY